MKVIIQKRLKSRYKWQSIFMPSGAFVAGRTDQKHWLKFAFFVYGNYPVLMTGSKLDATEFRTTSLSKWINSNCKLCLLKNVLVKGK